MLAPAFLLGLLAIGLPLWLHRMARANPTRAPFPSLMFIEESETTRSARRSLRYWGLLALRVLLIAALALAFAEPLLAPQTAAPLGARGQLHAIVLDASYSMREGERWPQALQRAEAILNQVRGADRVMLVRAAGQRVEIVHEPAPAVEAGAVRAALRRLEPTLARLDYGRAMNAAQQWLGPDAPAATLHFISDLQWSGAPLRFADLEPPPNTQLQLHAVATQSQANAFIAAATLAETDRRTLHATVRHTGPTAQARELRLLVDGVEQQRLALELPAAQVQVNTASGEGGGAPGRPGEFAESGAQHASGAATVTASFTQLELAPGAHRLELILEPHDSLPEDDRFRAVIERVNPRALLIANSERADDATYFAAALSAVQSPQLTVEQHTAAALTAESLHDASVAVVADLGALSMQGAERLHEFVAGGGGVLAALGAAEQIEPSPLLPDWRIGPPRARPGRVGKISTAHPILRQPGDWRRVRSFKQRTVEPQPEDRVLIEYEDGAPLLIERQIGAGRLLVLTAPLDRSWNDLAIHPLFVQFIAATGRYLTGGDAAPVSHAVGAVVMTGLTPTQGGQIFGPEGERVLSLAQVEQAERLIPTAAGFYEVRGGAGARWLAVNVDSRESDLTPLPAEFIERWRTLPMREPTRAAQAASAPAQPRSLGALVLWLAAALMLAELIVANRRLAIRRSGST